jgi:hypothetical protein
VVDSASDSVPSVTSNAESRGPASALSATADSKSLVEKAIAALPPELSAQATDPKRKARSQDPRWKFGWWPDTTKKDLVQCIFCSKIVPSGIKRFKQYLAGGFGDTMHCARIPELVSKEMHTYLKRNMKLVITTNNEEDEEGEERNDEGPGPSSRTKTSKQKRKFPKLPCPHFLYLLLQNTVHRRQANQ